MRELSPLFTSATRTVEVVRLHAAHQPRSDELALARVRRGREEAARAFGRTKDLATLQATMARLEVEERLAREPSETRRLTPGEVVEYARSLPRLWADSAADGRQTLVTAIFARLDVLGFQQLDYELTEDAVDLGLDAALPRILDLESKIAAFGRGERI